MANSWCLECNLSYVCEDNKLVDCFSLKYLIKSVLRLATLNRKDMVYSLPVLYNTQSHREHDHKIAGRMILRKGVIFLTIVATSPRNCQVHVFVSPTMRCTACILHEGKFAKHIRTYKIRYLLKGRGMMNL